MGFKDLFNNNYETSEMSSIEVLKTRYYRNRYEDVIDVIRRMVKEEKGTIKAEIENFLEIFFETVDYTCTATIVGVRPSETAVDFKVTTYKVLPNGKGKKIIERLYKYLDKNLTFKGVSLYK